MDVKKKIKRQFSKYRNRIGIGDAIIVAMSEETPQVLQRQIVMRFLAAGVSLILWFVLLAIGIGWLGCLLFLLLPVAFAALAFFLILQCGQKKYVTICGVCTGVDHALFSRKHYVKSFTLKADQEAFKVLCKNQKLTDIAEGDRMAVYLASEGQIQRYANQTIISTYLAIEKVEQNC